MLSTPLRKLALILDDKTRLHDQIKPSSWWSSTNGKLEVLDRAKDHAPMPKLKAQQDRVKAIRDEKRKKGEL